MSPGTARSDKTRIAARALPLERRSQPTMGIAVTNVRIVNQRPMLKDDIDPSSSPQTKKTNTVTVTAEAAANAMRKIHSDRPVMGAFGPWADAEAVGEICGNVAPFNTFNHLTRLLP